MKLAHVINIFTPDYISDLYVAQPITLESMRVAHDYAADEVDVTLYSAHFKEDEAMVPDYFKKTPFLERSVVDRANLKKRKNYLLSAIYWLIFTTPQMLIILYIQITI